MQLVFLSPLDQRSHSDQSVLPIVGLEMKHLQTQKKKRKMVKQLKLKAQNRKPTKVLSQKKVNLGYYVGLSGFQTLIRFSTGKF